MANPALSQTSCTALFARLALPGREWMVIRETLNRFRRSVVRYKHINDYNANFSTTTQMTFSGVRLSANNVATANVSTSGEIIWRIVANGGNWDINGYTATGGVAGTKCCTATNIAAGATFSLTASNSSGLTGTGKLAGSVTAETDDKHRTRVFPDFSLQLDDAFDGTDSLDAQTKPVMQAFHAQCASALSSLDTGSQSLLGRILAIQIGPEMLVGTPTGALFSVAATTDANGAVTLAVTGSADDLRGNMAANTTAQTVLRVAPGAGSPTYSGSGAANASVGTGVLAIASQYDNAIVGTLTFLCTDSTVGQEKFTAILVPTDLSPTLSAEAQLTPGQAWKSAKLGIASATLTRTLTKTGDGTNVDFAAASNFTVTGLSSSNSSAGSFGMKVTANASNWDYTFYSSTTNFATAYQVAQATNVVTGATFVATALNRSGLVVAGKAGSAPTTTNTAVLNCNPFSTGPTADRIDVAITLANSPGWQQFWANVVGWYLNGATSNPTIPEGLITAASNVLDNFLT